MAGWGVNCRDPEQRSRVTPWIARYGPRVDPRTGTVGFEIWLPLDD